MAVDRIIQPRISEFPSVNDPYSSSHHPAPTSAGGEPPKKKRGRPSKAEYEVRVAEYAARGETYPAPRKSKTKRHSTGSQGAVFPTTKTEAGESRPPSALVGLEASEADSPPGRRRARPSKLSRNFTLDTSALEQRPGESARTDVNTLAEAASDKPGPENQPSDLGYQGNLAVQMQEHAARVESEPRREVENVQGRHTPENRAWQTYHQVPSTT